MNKSPPDSVWTGTFLCPQRYKTGPQGKREKHMKTFMLNVVWWCVFWYQCHVATLPCYSSVPWNVARRRAWIIAMERYLQGRLSDYVDMPLGVQRIPKYLSDGEI
jgi:hypothetical protein